MKAEKFHRPYLRRIIVMVSLFSAVVHSASISEAQQRVRKSIDAYTAGEFLDYIHAVKKLRERSSTDPTIAYSYAHMAGMHNRPTLFNGACEHWNHRFLAWHRALLYNYEDALRAIDPPRTANVTIPYWDWSIAPTGKRFAVAFENDPAAVAAHYGQPIPADALKELYSPIRNDAPSLPLYPWDVLDEIARMPSKVGFAGPATGHGALENPPHDSLHGFIGGDLVRTSTAANDAIFWSYHAFIDLVWWWRQKQLSETPDCMICPMRGMPVKTALGAQLNTASAQPPLLQHVFDTNVLKYTYQFTPPPPSSPVTMASVKARTFSERYAALAAMALNKPDHVWTLNAKSVPGASGKSVILSDVASAKAFAYIAFVYVHPANVPFKPTDQGFRDAYLVGHYAQWVNEHAEHGSGHGHGRDFDIRFERDAYPLLNQQQGSEHVVTVAIHVQSEVAEATVMTAAPEGRAAVLRADTRIGSAAFGQ